MQAVDDITCILPAFCLRFTCVLPVAVAKGRFCLPLPDIGRFADEWLDLNSANQNRFNSWRQHATFSSKSKKESKSPGRAKRWVPVAFRTERGRGVIG